MAFDCQAQLYYELLLIIFTIDVVVLSVWLLSLGIDLVAPLCHRRWHFSPFFSAEGAGCWSSWIWMKPSGLFQTSVLSYVRHLSDYVDTICVPIRHVSDYEDTIFSSCSHFECGSIVAEKKWEIKWLPKNVEYAVLKHRIDHMGKREKPQWPSSH